MLLLLPGSVEEASAMRWSSHLQLVWPSHNRVRAGRWLLQPQSRIHIEDLIVLRGCLFIRNHHHIIRLQYISPWRDQYWMAVNINGPFIRSRLSIIRIILNLWNKQLTIFRRLNNGLLMIKNYLFGVLSTSFTGFSFSDKAFFGLAFSR